MKYVREKGSGALGTVVNQNGDTLTVKFEEEFSPREVNKSDVTETKQKPRKGAH